MRGSQRTWIILAVLALIVGLLYYLLEVQGVAQETDEEGYVWELEAEQVVGVRVTDNLSGTVTALERMADGVWWVVEPVTAQAAPDEALSLIYALAYMPIQRTIEEPPPGELETYGLNTPAYTFEVRLDGGRVLRLEVGGRYLSGAYYVRREGERPVLLVPEQAVEDVTRILAEPPVREPPTPTPGLPIAGPDREE